MRSVAKRLARGAVCAALVMILFLHGAVEASAITTKFMVPTISNAFTPDNCIYKSPNLNIMVSKWGYGWVVDMLNTANDIDGLLAELNANFTVPASSSKEAIMGIYMEGAPITAQNAADIAAGGWKRVELYYEEFMISGSLPRGIMEPRVAKIDDTAVQAVLTDAGITADTAVLEVAGLDMEKASVIFYEKEFKFLRGKSVSAYKFLPDLKKFVPVGDSHFDSFGRNFLDMYDLQNAEADVNGIYVALGQTLPAEAVITAEDAVELRKNPPKEPAVLTNDAETVAWRFAEGEVPEGFTAEAEVTADGGAEVTVDFAYSGLLPVGTEVTVQIPVAQTAFAEGTPLCFYYCDPDAQVWELVSRSVVQEGKVTFEIGHCSVYVITSEDHGERWQPPVQESASDAGGADAPGATQKPGEVAPAPDAPGKPGEMTAPDAPSESITFPSVPAVPGEKPGATPPASGKDEKPAEGDTVTDPVITIGAIEEPGKAANPLMWAGIGAACAAVIAVVILRKKRK